MHLKLEQIAGKGSGRRGQRSNSNSQRHDKGSSSHNPHPPSPISYHIHHIAAVYLGHLALTNRCFSKELWRSYLLWHSVGSWENSASLPRQTQVTQAAPAIALTPALSSPPAAASFSHVLCSRQESSTITILHTRRGLRSKSPKNHLTTLHSALLTTQRPMKFCNSASSQTGVRFPFPLLAHTLLFMSGSLAQRGH